MKKGCDCHPTWQHQHDHGVEREAPHEITPRSESGLERNQNHDREVELQIDRWRTALRHEGGVVLEVISENQLRREFGRLVNTRVSDREKQEAADAVGITLVAGKAQFPDARLIVERGDGRIELHDIEIVSRHYKPRAIQAKAAAGFRLSRGSNFIGRSVHDGPGSIDSLLKP